MNRAAVLQRVCESFGIRNYGRWVQEEVHSGEADAVLEKVTLFCAIASQMLQSADFFDSYAASFHTRPVHTDFDHAVSRIAQSNCDREVLVEVIRYFQTAIALEFFAIHDGMTVASREVEEIRYRLAYCRNGEDENTVRYLPGDLYDSFNTFLEDLADEKAIFDEPESEN